MAERSQIIVLALGGLAFMMLLAACTAPQTTSTASSPTAATPTSTAPSPESTPSPTEPSKTLVYYDLLTRIIPIGDARSTKRTRLTLVFQEVRPGAGVADEDRFIGPEVPHSPQLNADSPLSLAPGEYEATTLVFPPQALGGKEEMTVLLVNGRGQRLHGPTFTVPTSGCVYLGAIMFTFVRVAPGGKAKQFELAQEGTSGAAAQIILNTKGSLLWFVNDSETIKVSVDKAMQSASGAGNCVVERWKDPVKS